VCLNSTSVEGDEIELKVREIIGHDFCYNGVFPHSCSLIREAKDGNYVTVLVFLLSSSLSIYFSVLLSFLPSTLFLISYFSFMLPFLSFVSSFLCFNMLQFDT
jgi:hypothetical protein